MDVQYEIMRLGRKIARLERQVNMCQTQMERYIPMTDRIILEYERSIGRRDSMLDELSEEMCIFYANVCMGYLEFGRDVDACMERKLHQLSAVRICRTPETLIDVGCSDTMMYMTQNHLRNAMKPTDDERHHHGLSVEQMKALPEKLEQPVAITQSEKYPDEIQVFLDMREYGMGLCVAPVKKDGTAYYDWKTRPCNFVKSIYEKRNALDIIRLSAQKGKLLYLDKEKSRQFQSEWHQSPKYRKQAASGNNVPELRQDVKETRKYSPAGSRGISRDGKTI